MSISVGDVITRYFEAADPRDVDACVALFTDDGVVVDEGKTHRGTTEIRSWQAGGPSTYQYITEVIGAEPTGEDTYRVIARLDGSFPGGSAELQLRFTVAGERPHPHMSRQGAQNGVLGGRGS